MEGPGFRRRLEDLGGAGSLPSLGLAVVLRGLGRGLGGGGAGVALASHEGEHAEEQETLRHIYQRGAGSQRGVTFSWSPGGPRLWPAGSCRAPTSGSVGTSPGETTEGFRFSS